MQLKRSNTEDNEHQSIAEFVQQTLDSAVGDPIMTESGTERVQECLTALTFFVVIIQHRPMTRRSVMSAESIDAFSQYQRAGGVTEEDVRGLLWHVGRRINPAGFPDRSEVNGL